MSSTSADSGSKIASAACKRWGFGDCFDLALIGSTHGLSDGFSNLLVPVLALVVADLGLSNLEAGFLLSAYSVATFLCMYPISLVADRTGEKRLILVAGLGLAAFAYLAMGCASGLAMAAGLAFVAGVGNSTYHPCGTALTAQRFRDRRAVAISFHGLAGNIGASVIPLLQSGLVALALGWRAAVAACVLPAAVLLPLVLWRYRDDAPALPAVKCSESGTGFLKLIKKGLRNRSVLLLAATYGFKGLGAKGLIGFLPLIGAQRFGMDTTTIGVAVSLYLGAGIAAKALMGWLYSKWGARMALVVPLLLTGVFALAIGLTPWSWTLLPMAVAVGIVSPISPVILTAAADACDEEVLASSVGFIYTCHGLGFLSTLVGGWLAEKFGLSASYVFFAAAMWGGMAVSALLPGRVMKREKGVV